MNELLHHLDAQDALALLFFIACWAGYGFYTRHTSRVGLLAVTHRYRKQWMQQMLGRDNRSVDAIMIGNLMRSITFSANTTIFILAGLIGMLSYHEQVGSLISAIPFAKPITPIMWEIKIALLILIFIYAFFKYTWSMRQHNYTSILVAAAPLDSATGCDAEKEDAAEKAAFLAGNAAEHFNSGLRAYYFGLAALAWFVHPFAFMAATAVVVYVTHRREYRSHTLQRLATDA
ncbi:MAG: DUF599 domain-containing protein [Alphaproteobacteria bacterium]|nr:DUF599 domain-containing protein [Alphaproteobacteria bacterium]